MPVATGVRPLAITSANDALARLRRSGVQLRIPFRTRIMYAHATMRRICVFLILWIATLSCFARDSAEHWFEVRTPHFVVLTDSSDKQGLRIASQFERMRAVFHLVMPAAADDTGSPVIVLALKNRKALQSVEPAVYLAKGQLDLAGYFMRAPDKNYILLRLDAAGAHPFATIYHEYTHFMLRHASEWIPVWLNEGLAEFYQNTDIQNKEVLLGEASGEDILYLRQNKLLPLTTLLKVDQTSPYYHEEQKASVFYAESWALTHFIEISDGQKGTNRLQDYANRLVRKEDSLGRCAGGVWRSHTVAKGSERLHPARPVHDVQAEQGGQCR